MHKWSEESAARHDLDLPLVSAIREQLEQGAREHGDKDTPATSCRARRTGPRPETPARRSE